VDGEAADVAEQLGEVRRELARIAFAEPDPLRTEDRSKRTAKLSIQREELERSLQEQSAVFRRELAAWRATPAALCDALPNGRNAIVDLLKYAYGDHRYLAFVMAAEDCTVHRVELGPAAPIDAAVRQWREVLADPQALQNRVDARGVVVQQLVWAPLADALGSASRVLVVPDGPLTGAPLGALPTGEGRYLLEDVAISYLDLANDLLEPPDASATGALIVGGADYDAEREGKTGERARLAPCNDGGFQALEGASAEADLVTSQWEKARRQGAIDRLGGAEATEDSVTEALRGKALVHIATHGFFATGRCRSMLTGDGDGFDPMLLSGLALAGANQPPNPLAADDGILTAAELAGIDLSGTELVVLSACETGLGEVRSGEGVLGLRRAFSIAGARNLITSLWAVPDAATAELMDEMYRSILHRRRPLPAADALRKAKLALLSRQRASNQIRPQEWAGFIVSGPPSRPISR